MVHSLQDSLYAIDRVAEIRVYVNGLEIPAGIDQDGNAKEFVIDFEIDQLPPTLTIELAKIPSWVDVDHDIWVDGGYDGNFRRIFTGFVKKRRHSWQGDTLDCSGKTSVLTRAYRVLAKSWGSVTVEAAVEDILNDLTPPLVDYNIDASVADFVLGTAKIAVLDAAPPSDMIHSLVDIDGHRTYETPGGTLIIRPLLEAPAPTGIRVYSTDESESDETSDTTDDYPDSNIDTALNIGDVLANTARGQGVTPTADGTIVEVSVWLKKVGAPTDKVHFELREDDGAGLPGTLVLGGAADYPGSTLSTANWTKVTFKMPANPSGDGTTPTLSGTVYHLVISRSGALDVANYYTFGADASAPSYAGGQASVYNDTSWSAVAGTDMAFEVVTRVYPKLRILDISDDEDVDQVKKKIYVLGAVIASTDSEGNETAEQIEQTAVNASDDLVVGDPELYSMQYQNPLIDTLVQAGKTALRLIDKYHRVLDTVQLRVPFDPLVALGSTVEIDDPNITGKTGNWWVLAYKHVLAQGELATEMSLYGGDQSGTTGNLAPTAGFNFVIERELIGTAVQVAITFTDDSKDYDGVIVNYRWQDDYAGGAMDISGPNVYTVTRIYDPAVDAEFTVTLTVTDNLGLTGVYTYDFDLDAVGEGALDIFMPQMSCAAGNTCMYSPDGGTSWVDLATPSGLAKATEMYLAPDPEDIPYIVFGTDSGRVYRTIDGNLTLSLVLDAGAANPIADIVQAPLQAGRLWLVTTTGLVYQTVDWGANWVLYADLAGTWPIVRRMPNDPTSGSEYIDPTPCSKILASAPGVNRLWVVGGQGDDPATWVISNYLPDGQLVWWSQILPGASPPLLSTGDASDTVIDTVISHGSSGDLGLLFSGRNNPPQTMYCYGPPNWYEFQEPWVEGVGLPVGVDGRGVAGNNENFQEFLLLLDNKNAYRSFVGEGRIWEEFMDVLPGTAANRPNSLHNMTLWWGIYVSAQDEGIAKTVTFGESWAFLRPNAGMGTTWPAGAIGWDVSFEYRRPRAFKLLASVYDTTSGKTATMMRTDISDWTKQSEDGTAYTTCHIYNFAGMGNVLFRVRSTGSTYEGAWQTLQRSPDLGVTWNNTTVVGCSDITRAPNGDLYCLGTGGDTQTHRVFLSTNNGVDWTEVYEDTVISGGKYSRYRRIIVDPGNSDRVMAFGWREGTSTSQVFLISLDATLGAGASYSRLTPTFTDGAENTNVTMVPGQSERIFVAYEDSSGTQIFVDYSDDNGVNWANSLTFTVSGNPPPRVMFRGGMDIYLFVANSSGIKRTQDNGDSWQTFADLSLPTAGRGLAWDSVNDLLYSGQNDAPEVNTILQMADVIPPGTWDSVSDGLDAATGFVDNQLCSEGLEMLRA